MIIRKLTSSDTEQARALALENYIEERTENPALPQVLATPKLDYFIENEFGVCAVDGDRLLGFLCWYEPWKGGYDTFDDLCIFIPCHAHGAVCENRKRIYQDMFEYSAAQLAKEGVKGYGISMYAHDRECLAGFFEYGFGMRCSDEVRLMEPFRKIQNESLSFSELALCDFPKLRQLRKALNDHLRNSPCFMQNTDDECDVWLDSVEKGDRRTFVARKGDKIVSYLDVKDEGENFTTEFDGFQNLQGAWCDPAYRGQDITADLLEYVIEVLKKEGNTILGVDHETYNPAANRFWHKYFSPYTYSLTRHIENWATK